MQVLDRTVDYAVLLRICLRCLFVPSWERLVLCNRVTIIAHLIFAYLYKALI